MPHLSTESTPLNGAVSQEIILVREAVEKATLLNEKDNDHIFFAAFVGLDSANSTFIDTLVSHYAIRTIRRELLLF